MMNRRPSPVNDLTEGVVKGEGGRDDLFVFGKKCLSFGDTLISLISKKKSYLAKVILLISEYS